MAKILMATISGSYIAGDKQTESYDNVTGYLPFLDMELHGTDKISKADQMIIKRYARIWIGQTKKLNPLTGEESDEPKYKRVGRVREVFIDSIEEIDGKKLSYVGKSIMDMNFEELQDLAAAKDLSAIPFYKSGSLTLARRIAFSEYAIKVLDLDQKSYDYKLEGFSPSRFAPIVADSIIRLHGVVPPSLDETIDREMLREELARDNPKAPAGGSRLTIEQLRQVAKAKGVEFTPKTAYDTLYKKCYPDAAA